MHISSGPSKTNTAYFIGEERFDNKIAAIKAVRDRTSTGLLAAKIAVESFPDHFLAYCRIEVVKVPTYIYHMYGVQVDRDTFVHGISSNELCYREEAVTVLEKLLPPS